MPQAQGFFDPTMPGPNLGAGFKDIAMAVVENQRYQEAQRLQGEELKQGQEKIDIDRIRAEAYGKYVEGQGQTKMPDWVQKGIFLNQVDPGTYPTVGSGVQAILKIKKDEPIPAQVDTSFENSVLIPQFGKDWRKDLPTERFWDVWKEHEMATRPSKIAPQTDAEYREEVMKYDLGMDKVKLNGLKAISDAQNADIMVQFGDEEQKMQAGQRYIQQAQEFIKMWTEQREQGHQSINQAFLKSSTAGRTSDSGDVTVGGGEPRPPTGWVKVGTTQDGRTIYLTPEGKRKIWSKR
jgi:hypothetical protein